MVGNSHAWYSVNVTDFMPRGLSNAVNFLHSRGIAHQEYKVSSRSFAQLSLIEYSSTFIFS